MSKTGLIIGKFSPLHNGHLALINFGLKHCEQLIIAFSPTPEDYVSTEHRLKWFAEIFPDRQRVRVETIPVELPDSNHGPDRDVSRAWSDYLKKRFPEVDCIFTSELYGDYMAEYMGIRHIMFDLPREGVPVSATRIRQNPLFAWDYLPQAVRPYFVKKICVYGPESTGKTTLAGNLAKHYHTEWVPEMARDILGDRHCVYEDIYPIADLHAREINRKIKTANKLLFVDTDILTTRIYSQSYFGQVPDFPQWIEDANKYDLYLFLDIDVPWVADPQRDYGDKREFFREWFLRELQSRGIEPVMISGGWQQRWEQAVAVVNKLVSNR